MGPFVAVVVAGVLNEAGAFMSTAMAEMVGKGMVDPAAVMQEVVGAALAGAIRGNFPPVAEPSDQFLPCADRGHGQARHGFTADGRR